MSGGPPPVGDSLRRRIGSAAQLVRVDRARLTDGPAAGAPVLIVRNPRGISFEVLLDRAMDIGWADAVGTPLAWASARGRVAATRDDPSGAGWGATFGGGLLTTCGLASTGAPSSDDGRSHLLHGRVGGIPAEDVSWTVSAGSAGPEVVITGSVLEAGLGDVPLRLIRTIRARCDSPELVVEDVVVNEGFSSAGHMFRHHVNLGYPLVDGQARIVSDARAFAMRDGGPVVAVDATGLEVAPERAAETVAYAQSGAGVFTISSPVAGVALSLEWSTATFPLFLVWRDASPGVNVLGVEPSTSRDGGRAEARRQGELILLDPGERRSYSTRFAVTPLS